MKFKPLPIGVDNFVEIIEKGYYYVDKTKLIKELIDMKGKVNLFTRPRRFGKTLNLSMLQCFFEMGYCNAELLFKGLAIMDTGEEYTRHMSQYPVVSISLKSMKQESFELSYMQMKKTIAEEFGRHDIILKSDKLTDAIKERFLSIRDEKGSDADYRIALKFLSACLRACYGRKAIILIDEYDVPLENSYFCGFYNQMLPVIRSLFESALKTNDNLEFAVITGCLRISKESIFTGLNNLKVISVTSPIYAEHFGFTEKEVISMLDFYERGGCFDIVKKWYDGYLFGEIEVYNPWSVINYVEQIWVNEKAFPQPFWSNTSSNSIIRELVEGADFETKKEIENLIAGEVIEKPFYEEITYGNIHETADNLWNFLFFTGYLKKTGERLQDDTVYLKLGIPNAEVRTIYRNTILNWFDQKVKNSDMLPLFAALDAGDCEAMESFISDQLMDTISFFDYAENYYHGFLVGLLKTSTKYLVYSNRESGMGRPDILLKTPSVRGGAVILELKTVDEYQKMETACQKALEQIYSRNYEAQLQREGYSSIRKYGICFYRKDCMVRSGE